jgi:ribosomal protein S27E
MPNIGDTAKGKDIAKTNGTYIYLACPNCGGERWVEYNHAKYKKFIMYCIGKGCQQKNRASKVHKNNPIYWDGKSELKLNMQKSAPELLNLGIGVSHCTRGMMEWHECPQCKDRYWRFINPNSVICPKCTRINNGKKMHGEKSGRWNGGRWIDNKSGYINLTIQPDNPYYTMSDDGKIREHRLVMAQYLGRLLEPYEVVHHKGTRFPQGSPEDKQDNRIENLELLSPISHLPHSRLSLRVKELEAENILLKQQIESLLAKTK